MGASGSPRTAVTFSPERGEFPVGSVRTRLPSSAPPRSDTGRELRTRLSTGASQALPAPSNSITPSIESAAAGSFFIGWAIQPDPASSVRASTRSPTLSAATAARGPFTLPRASTIRRRGGGIGPPDPMASGCQVSGMAKTSPSSIAITRRTVTFGTPPIRWNAVRFPSIRPSSAISRSSALSAIFSAPFSPKAWAISRLPAVTGEVWMKSRTCLRLGISCGWPCGWRSCGLVMAAALGE